MQGRRARRLSTLAFSLACQSGLAATPVENKQVRTVPVYGNFDEDGHYSVDLTVGTPPQRLRAVLDMTLGSISFPCRHQAGGGLDDLTYDPERSSSMAPTACEGCPGACDGDDRCTWSSNASGIVSGIWIKDRVALSEARPGHEAASVDGLACHYGQFNPSVSGRSNGVFGLGLEANSIRSILGQDTDGNNLFFSLCLSRLGGELTINGYDEDRHTATIQWVPMRPAGPVYVSDLASLSVGNVTVDANVTATIDVGSIYSYFPSAVYAALRGAVESHAFPQGAAVQRRGSCWHLPGLHEDLDSFPGIFIRFAGSDTAFEWKARSYLARRGRTSLWCYAFDEAALEEAVLGASWMLHQETVVDPWQQRMWIAPAKCPEHVRGEQDEPPLGAGPSPTAASDPAAATGAGADAAAAPVPTTGAPSLRGKQEEQEVGDVVALPPNNESSAEFAEVLADGQRAENSDDSNSQLSMVVAAMAACLALGGLLCGTQGLSLLTGRDHRRVQLRENIMEDMLPGEHGGQRGHAPVHLAGTQEEAAAEDQE